LVDYFKDAFSFGLRLLFSPLSYSHNICMATAASVSQGKAVLEGAIFDLL